MGLSQPGLPLFPRLISSCLVFPSSNFRGESHYYPWLIFLLLVQEHPVLTIPNRQSIDTDNMGGSVSKMMGKIFGTKEMRILMLGLDAAGKTSKISPLLFSRSCDPQD